MELDGEVTRLSTNCTCDLVMCTTMSVSIATNMQCLPGDSGHLVYKCTIQYNKSH